MVVETPPIDRVVADAIPAGRVRPGARPGEPSLAAPITVSRTVAPKALIRLEARAIVEVVPRRGWSAIAPSFEEAQEAFQTRRAPKPAS